MLGKFSALITFAVLLSGCGSKWLEEEFYNSQIIQGRDYAPFGPKFHPAPVYCYKTLAGADCYSSIQPGRSEQLIEFYPEYPPVCWQENEVKVGMGRYPSFVTPPVPLIPINDQQDRW